MMQSNKIHRTIRLAVILGIAGVMTFSRCTKVDDLLGSGLEPSDQQMKISTKIFTLSDQPDRPFFETRLYHTDSIKSSNLGTGYFGVMNDETFGSRKVGLLSQYIAAALSNTEGFGYRPIFDSIQLKILVSEYGGDTLQPIKYNIYEIVSNDYLNPSLPAPAGAGDVADTLFYSCFDPMPYVNPEPVFTFTFPNGHDTGPHTEYITLQPTEQGMNLIKRLMLLEGEYKDDMTIYEQLDLWTNYFKGIYIAPAEEITGRGNMFATSLSGSGLYLYARNRNRTDPTLIQDTVTASYAFYISSSSYPTASINTIRHDYTGSQITIADADEKTQNRPLNPNVYVEGMDGVITELTFTDALFEQMRKLYDGVTDESGKPYTSIAINRAQLMIFLDHSNYDWDKIDVGAITPLLDSSFARLGLYTDYKKLIGISDYSYAYERLYSSSGFKLPYGGYLNRSLGCYVMDITSYLQSIWNGYLKSQGEDVVQNEESESRTIYIGPEAYGLYSMPYTTAQGMEDEGNNAPIMLNLVYTMIK